MPKLSETGWRYLWLTLFVIITDRITKLMALKYLLANQALPIMPGFNLTLAYNTGAAFSFLSHLDGWQNGLFVAIAVLVSLGIVAWLWRLPAKARWSGVALSLILGGALGNLWDRVALGYVVDFVHWYVGSYSWPIFNIADSAITVGAFCLIVAMFRKEV